MTTIPYETARRLLCTNVFRTPEGTLAHVASARDPMILSLPSGWNAAQRCRVVVNTHLNAEVLVEGSEMLLKAYPELGGPAFYLRLTMYVPAELERMVSEPQPDQHTCTSNNNTHNW